MVQAMKDKIGAWLIYSKNESMPADELWAEALEKDCPGLFAGVDREEVDVQNIDQMNRALSDLASTALFGGRRLTVMRIAPKNMQLLVENAEMVAAAISGAAEESYLIIMTHSKDAKDANARTIPAALKKTLAASGCRYIEVTSLVGKKDFASLIAAEAHASGLVLSVRQMDEIAVAMKGDAIALRQEIGKIRMAADESGKIDDQIFQRLLYSENVENIFALLDAFFEGRTVQFAANMLQLENETLLYGILPMLSRQCRMIRDVRKLLSDGVDEKEIFKRTELKHSFQLDKIRRQSRAWSDEKLAELENRLACCERKSKQGQIADRGIWLEAMLFGMTKDNKKK